MYVFALAGLPEEIKGFGHVKLANYDKAKVAEALNNTEGFPGVSGVINLKGNNGDPPKRALVVEVIKEGQKFAKAYEPNEVFN